MKSGLFAFLLAVSLVLILTGPLVAQTTTDLSSVPSKSQKACRERAAKEFRVKTKDIRITGLRLDRSAFRPPNLRGLRHSPGYQSKATLALMDVLFNLR